MHNLVHGWITSTYYGFSVHKFLVNAGKIRVKPQLGVQFLLVAESVPAFPKGEFLRYPKENNHMIVYKMIYKSMENDKQQI